MASGTAASQARPGRGDSLDQARASEQALPLALEGSGALEVGLEQEKETDSHTGLVFPCVSKDGKHAPTLEGTPARDPPLARSSSQSAVPSPSSLASVGSRRSRSIQTRWAWPTWCEAGKLTCTEACFSSHQGKRKAWPKPCTWSGQVPTVEAMALGRGGQAAE